jgi:hypothetical protein
MAANNSRVSNLPLPLEGASDENARRLPLVVFMPRMREFFHAAGLLPSVERPLDFDWQNANAGQLRDNSLAVSYLRSALSSELASLVENIPYINVMWARLSQVQLWGVSRVLFSMSSE